MADAAIRWLPAAGLGVWLAVAGLRVRDGGLDEAGLAELIVLFIALTPVPLAVRLAVCSDMSEGTSRKVQVVVAAAALGLAIGVAGVETGGALAAGLAIPWLLVTAAVALHAGLRLLRRRPLVIGASVLDVGVLILPGAAVWLLVYRTDSILGGFGGLAAVLTAGHFHAAGFGAMVMAGLVGRGLARAGAARALRVHAVMAVSLVIAFGLLAAGIASGVRAIELAGSCIYAAALPTLAVLQGIAAVRTTGGGTRVLLLVSSLALLWATGYALVFAAQGFYGAAVPISMMLRMHAAVNAFGFLGLGLWGWARAERAV